jgi:hypothetical protein
MEQINFSAQGDVQGIPIRLEVVSMWWRSQADQPESASSRIKVLSPKGDILGELENRIDLTNHRRLRLRWQLMGLPFVESGIYRFALEIESNGEWKSVTSVPLEIVRDYPEGSPS